MTPPTRTTARALRQTACGMKDVYYAQSASEQLPLSLPRARGWAELAEGASHRASLEVGWIPGGR